MLRPPVPVVVAVSRDGDHRFSKAPVPSITILEDLGVEGDAHAGRTVRHRSRVARDPSQPNLRQVHLLPAEFLDEAGSLGFAVGPGDLGENILTRGLDLAALGRDTLLHIGPDAALRVTGLRNPCVQIDAFRPGLLALALRRDGTGSVVRAAGIMTVVVRGGVVLAGDLIRVDGRAGAHMPLEVV